MVKYTIPKIISGEGGIMTQPIYESFRFNRNKLKFCDSVKANCKTDVKSKDVLKVLNVSAIAVGTQTEIKEQNVKVGGRIIFFATYLNTEGEVKKCECGSEILAVFSDETVKKDMHAYATASVEKTERTTDGEYLTLSAIVKVCASLFGEEEVKAFSGGDGLITDKCEIVYDKTFSQEKGVYPFDEEFDLPYLIGEVLSQSMGVSVSAVQCGVGSVIVDGEIYFSALLLQKGGKSDIIREDRTIPFRIELDSQEAMPSMSATSMLSVKSFKTDIACAEEDNKSTVTLSIDFSYENRVYAKTSAEIVADAFCEKEEIEVVPTECVLDYAKEVRLIKKTISGRAETEELPIGARITAVSGEKIELTSVVCENSKIKVEGVFSLTTYYKDQEADVFTFNVEIPFETSFESPDIGNDATVLAVIERASAKTHSITQTEIMAEVAFSIYPTEQKTVKIISEVKSIGERQPENSAISVYIPFTGEKLWSLAKRLGVSPEQVLKSNPDLQFPLTGDERIVIYRGVN